MSLAHLPKFLVKIRSYSQKQRIVSQFNFDSLTLAENHRFMTLLLDKQTGTKNIQHITEIAFHYLQLRMTTWNREIHYKIKQKRVAQKFRNVVKAPNFVLKIAEAGCGDCRNYRGFQEISPRILKM